MEIRKSLEVGLLPEMINQKVTFQKKAEKSE